MISDYTTIGRTIRELRKHRGYTGEQLARKSGLSQSKISRIETGTSKMLNPSEIERILNKLNATETIQQQILTLLGQNSSITLRRFKISYSFRQHLEDEDKTHILRNMSLSAIPALLQTAEYRQAWLKHIEISDDEIQSVMGISMKRQDLLWDKKHRYHFIIHESALYTAPSSRSVQLAQLDRIERFIGIQNITLGIVTLQTGWPVIENCAFALYDDRSVLRALPDGDTISQESGDVKIYTKLFDMLNQLAVYGDTAKSIINNAADYFS